MISRYQCGTTAYSSLNCFVYIYLQTAALVVNHVTLNKQGSFVFNVILFSDQGKEKVLCYSVNIEVGDLNPVKIYNGKKFIDGASSLPTLYQ